MFCDYCNKKILEHSSVYKGFDCLFCSSICRYEVGNINYKNDPKLCEFKKWYKYKGLPQYIETTPKKTKSIIDFENRNNNNYNNDFKIYNNEFKIYNNETHIMNEIFDYSYNYLNFIDKFKFINFLSSILYTKIY